MRKNLLTALALVLALSGNVWATCASGDLICYSDPDGSEFRVTTDGNMSCTGTAAVTGASTFTGAVSCDSTLDVDGNVTIGAAAYRSTFTAASGNAAIGGTLTSAGKLTVTSGGMDVAAGLARVGTGSTAGIADSDDDLFVEADLEVDDQLDVSGAVTLNGTADIDGNLTIGAASYRSTFTAASGNAAIGGTLTSAGKLTVTSGGADIVAGMARVGTGSSPSVADSDDDLFVEADLEVDDQLDVSGAVTLNSTVDIDGNVIAGAAQYRSTFTAASGALALTGALSTESTLDVDGNVTIGAAQYRSTFTAASGDAAIGGTLTSAGKLTVTAGGADVSGTLAVTGAETVSTTLSVTGDSYLGAAGFKSTNTATTGAWAFPASVSIGGQLGLLSQTTTQMATLTPACPTARVGCVIHSSTNNELCVSSGTAQGAWIQVSSQTVAGVHAVATCVW